MKVSNEVARELLELSTGKATTDWGDVGDPYPVNLELVHEDLIDTSRWSNIYERVYKDLYTGKFFHTTFSVGATECQDERAYEHDGDEIEFDEVVPRETTVIKYVPA